MILEQNHYIEQGLNLNRKIKLKHSHTFKDSNPSRSSISLSRFLTFASKADFISAASEFLKEEIFHSQRWDGILAIIMITE